MEQKFIAAGYPGMSEQPFATSYDMLENDIDVDVEFPSEDGKFGKVALGWRLDFR